MKYLRTTSSTPAPGFSLVEVCLALGLVAFVLLALLGLFAVGLNSSRESSMETALAQISLRASSLYPGNTAADEAGIVTYSETYDYEGVPKPAGDPQVYFTVQVTGSSANPDELANTSANLHLIILSITSAQNPGTIKIHSSAYVP